MPRPLAKQGLPGIGQDVFPESARETGRRLGLQEDAIKVLQYTEDSDDAGDVNPGWEDPDDVDAVRGYIVPIGRVGSEMLRDGRVVEGSTHRLYLDPDVALDPKDRIYSEGRIFIITSVHTQTDELLTSADLKIL